MKLRLQYFGHLMQTADSLEKSLILGKIDGRRKRGRRRMRRLDDIIDAMDVNLGKLWEMVRVREAWHVAVHGVTKSRIRLEDRTSTTRMCEHQVENEVETIWWGGVYLKLMNWGNSAFHLAEGMFPSSLPTPGWIFASSLHWPWLPQTLEMCDIGVRAPGKRPWGGFSKWRREKLCLGAAVGSAVSFFLASAYSCFISHSAACKGDHCWSTQILDCYAAYLVFITVCFIFISLPSRFA